MSIRAEYIALIIQSIEQAIAQVDSKAIAHPIEGVTDEFGVLDWRNPTIQDWLFAALSYKLDNPLSLSKYESLIITRPAEVLSDSQVLELVSDPTATIADLTSRIRHCAVMRDTEKYIDTVLMTMDDDRKGLRERRDVLLKAGWTHHESYTAWYGWYPPGTENGEDRHIDQAYVEHLHNTKPVSA